LHGKAGMQIKSPTAVAAVRGTEADVDVDNRMVVKVYEGLVDVSNDQGSQSRWGDLSALFPTKG
jgi:hypothetical protein